MLRPIDQDMTVVEKLVCYSQFPRGGPMSCLGVDVEHIVQHQDQPEGRGSKGKAWARVLVVVSRKETGEAEIQV